MDINQQILKVLEKYPSLRYDKLRNVIEGELHLTRFDAYQIELDLVGFPAKFPLVYEIAERIPRIADRHVYPGTGNCCLTTRAKESFLLKTRIRSLLDFVQLIVIPYFEHNSLFEIKRCYVNGEYSHSVEGIVEAYAEILKIKVSHELYIILNNRVNLKTLRSSDFCYCGSRSKLIQCSNGTHFKAYKDFMKVEDSIVFSDFNQLIIPYVRDLFLFEDWRDRSSIY